MTEKKELRRVKLTDDQYDRLDSVLSLDDDDIVKLVYGLIDRARLETQSAWTEMRRLAQVDDGQDFALSHITREIIVYENTVEANK